MHEFFIKLSELTCFNLSTLILQLLPKPNMEILTLFIYFALFILTAYFTFKHFFQTHPKKQLPPSPPFSLPIIGHLYLLKPPLHRPLAALAARYGPVLHLKFGVRRVLLLSSPSAVEECLIKNHVFLDRPQMSLPAKHQTFNHPSIPWAPQGPTWRSLRRIAAVEILSPQRLQILSSVRTAVARSFIKRMMKAVMSPNYNEARTVEMKAALFGLTLDNMMRMLAGKSNYLEEEDEEKKVSEASRRFQEIVEESFRVSGITNPEDFLPILKWFRAFRPGAAEAEETMKRAVKEKEAFMRELMEEHREAEKQGKLSDAQQKSMLHVMLGLQKEDPKNHTDEMIGSLLLTLFQGGTDTSASTTVWALSILLNHPEILKKAQAELDTVVGHHRLVDESDKANLPYLQAIITETFRFSPTGPLALPYETHVDCEVGGYHVPKGSMMIYNIWAIHNDPKIWDEPRKFKPERFVEVAEDETRVGMRSCTLMPFGTGKRICPGEHLATRVVWLAVAILVQCFEWERVSEELVDMREGLGVTLPKLEPLLVNCRPRPCMVDLLTQI